MIFMSKKGITIATIVVAAVVLSFVFYWFQIRPAQIRKECADVATRPCAGDSMAEQVAKKYGGTVTCPQVNVSERYYDEYFKRCMLEHGLEK